MPFFDDAAHRRARNGCEEHACSSVAFGKKFALAAFLLLAALSPDLARAAEIAVSSRDGLLTALQAAKGGEVIALAPGDYGKLALNGRKAEWARFPRTVTIKAQDAGNKPVFRGIALIGVANLALSEISVDYRFSDEDKTSIRVVVIDGSEGISLVGCIFDGDDAKNTESAADGFGTGIAIGVRRSSNIVVEGNEIRRWLRGAVFSGVDGLAVLRNDFHDLRSDGLDFADVDNAIIEGNHIHDFRRSDDSEDHPDMIQFWTRGTVSPSTNVVIRGNFLDAGLGGRTQSIFMRNEAVDVKGAGKEMFYKGIRIEGNVIRNGHGHGITVGESDGLTIDRNTILHSVSRSEGGKSSVPGVVVKPNSLGVEITRNIVPRISQSMKKPAAGWVVEGNFEVQRERAYLPNYYGNVFVNAMARKTMTLADLAVLPESAADKPSLGSALSVFNGAPPKPSGFIINTMKTAGGRTQAFDASNLFGPAGRIDLDGADARWRFGDGGTASGIRAEHTFNALGHYNVEVEIELRDGQKINLARSITVFAPGDVTGK